MISSSGLDEGRTVLQSHRTCDKLDHSSRGSHPPGKGAFPEVEAFSADFSLPASGGVNPPGESECNPCEHNRTGFGVIGMIEATVDC